MPWFPVCGHARCFPEVSLPELLRYRPESVAGSVAALRLLADAALRSRLTMPFLAYGVLALTATGRPSLSNEDRELFWRAFQVPVLEQCRCWDGSLYAEECAAHDGLHLRSAHSPVCVHGAAILAEPCACGDPAPRIVRASAVPLPLAATAG